MFDGGENAIGSIIPVKCEYAKTDCKLPVNVDTNGYGTGIKKTGYLFKGWDSPIGYFENTKLNLPTVTDDNEDDYETTLKFKNEEVCKNGLTDNTNTITFTADWEPIKYTVIYNGNNSTSGSKEPTIETYDVAFNLPNNVFSRTGYTFAGWTANANPDTAKQGTDSNASETWNGTTATKSTYFKNLTPTNNASVEMKAKWSANSGSIAYDYNGGTAGQNAPTSITYDQVIAISNPSRRGYNFDGWTGTNVNASTAKVGNSNNPTDAWNGTTKTTALYFKNLNPNTSATVTLKANWSANTYTVTLDRQSGTGGTATIYQKYDTGYYLDSAATKKMTTAANKITIPTRSGYTFGGYYTGKNGAGTQYIASSGYLTSNASTSNFAANGSLFAKWNGCGPGTYEKNGVCTACPVGTYSTGSANAACTPCPAGQYQNETGKSSCKACAAGTYQNETGKTSCKNCAAGTYQNETGKTSCKNCTSGTYQNETGKTSCKNCTAGTYQNETGKTSCKNCAAGTYQNETGKISCKSCPAGQYQNETGKTSCKNCAAGYFQDLTGQSSCVACAVGSYSGAAAKACIACQSGKTTNGTGKTSCNADCSNKANVSSWKTASWSKNTVSNLCAINSCASGYNLEGGVCKSAAAFAFRYTGSFKYKEGSGGEVSASNTSVTIKNQTWQVKFLTGGTLTVTSISSNIDVFLVGGGGGAGGCGDTRGGGGGGGGFTTTKTNLAIGTQNYSISIGGGAGCGGRGGASTAFGYSAAGGNPGASFWSGGAGGSGGSGGGGCFGGNAWPTPTGDGGSNGSAGTTGRVDTYAANGNYHRSHPGGSGCSTNGGCKINGSTCTNTRAFCEASGELYAGGGAGSDHEYCGRYGDGGGGGANSPCVCGCGGHRATANYGGGGAAAGGSSGIVIIRNKR